MTAVRAFKSPEIAAKPLGDDVRESHFEVALRAVGRSSELQWYFIESLCFVHVPPFEGLLDANTINYRPDFDALRQINYVRNRTHPNSGHPKVQNRPPRDETGQYLSPMSGSIATEPFSARADQCPLL